MIDFGSNYDTTPYERHVTLVDKIHSFGNKVLFPVALIPLLPLAIISIDNSESFKEVAIKTGIFVGGYLSSVAAFNVGMVLAKLLCNSDKKEWDANALRSEGSSFLERFGNLAYKPLYPGDPRIEGYGRNLNNGTNGMEQFYKLSKRAENAAWGSGPKLIPIEREIINNLSDEERNKIPGKLMDLVYSKKY